MRPLRLLVFAPVALGLVACASSSPAQRAPQPPASSAPQPLAPAAPAPVVSTPRSAPPARDSQSPGTSRQPARSPSAPASSPPPVRNPSAPPPANPPAGSSVVVPNAPPTRAPPPGSVSTPSAPPTGREPTPPVAPIRRPGRTLELADDRTGAAPAHVPSGVLTWQVHDSGIQCIAAPCPTYVAVRQQAKAPQELQFHELDLSKLTEKDAQRVRTTVQRQGSIALTGQFRTLRNRGPAGSALVLVVDRVGVSRVRK